MAKPKPVPSAHHVAALAGVSQAAVSRAFTEGASISDQTRSRVLVAARKLGYRPNLLARSLIKGRSGLIGVVLGNPCNPHCTEVLNALSNSLSKAGKHILIFTVEEHCNADVQVSDLLNFRTDALILVSAGLSTALVKQCRAAAIPVVFLSRLKKLDDHAISIVGDNAAGGRAIADHLIDQGYRNLAYMVGYSASWTNNQRQEAFTGRVVERGLPVPMRVPGHYQRAEAMKAARTLLSRRKRPDAIFCASDYMACATIDVARYEFGLEIGRDLGVVGFDDVAQASWPSFDLTTYTQPVAEMVASAVALLDRDGHEQGRHFVVSGELRVRASTQRG